MPEPGRTSRRNFLRNTVTGTVALPLLGALAVDDSQAETAGARSQVFRVNGCPVHDENLRHVGVDALLHLISMNGTKFYMSERPDDLCGVSGLIAANDVVILKVNAQWICRGGNEHRHAARLDPSHSGSPGRFHGRSSYF
jgi:hypothetical protein